MNDMLLDANIDSNMVIVNDNNDIDREVSKHKPKFVIIEALWVIPSKFSILTQLHKDVTWIIRLHSELPFLANEGMVLDWIGDYAGFNNVVIAANAPRALKDVIFFVKQKYALSDKDVKNKVIYLPNFYPHEFKNKILDKSKDTVDVACFGAIRPLKNHIVQALAAVKFADKIGKKLRFHFNSGRIEMNGGPIVRNLQSMFIIM